VVTVTKNELQGLLTLSFSIEFSDYGTTFVLKPSLCSICGSMDIAIVYII